MTAIGIAGNPGFDFILLRKDKAEDELPVIDLAGLEVEKV